MDAFERLKEISPEEAREIVLAWYPWWNHKDVTDFLITRTQWPLISNAELKKRICMAHLPIWSQYVEVVRKNGYDIDEKDMPSVG